MIAMMAMVIASSALLGLVPLSSKLLVLHKNIVFSFIVLPLGHA